MHETLLQKRLVKPKGGLIDVRSTLHHFALITYALPKSRLEKYIPADRFEIAEFMINGRSQALLSAVPFYDEDFRFVHLAPWLKAGFGQTNHRVYVIDRQTGEHGVWFFGTTLGSPIVYAARWLWGIPWHYARYQMNCQYDAKNGRYSTFTFNVASDWCEATIDIADTGAPMTRLDGFTSLEEMQLILTHPVDGFYYRLNGRLGSYSVWHNLILLTIGQPKNLYFGLYERLGLLSRAEMQKPHSILICPQTEFEVYLPPKNLVSR